MTFFFFMLDLSDLQTLYQSLRLKGRTNFEVFSPAKSNLIKLLIGSPSFFISDISLSSSPFFKVVYFLTAFFTFPPASTPVSSSKSYSSFFSSRPSSSSLTYCLLTGDFFLLSPVLFFLITISSSESLLSPLSTKPMAFRNSLLKSYASIWHYVCVSSNTNMATI